MPQQLLAEQAPLDPAIIGSAAFGAAEMPATDAIVNDVIAGAEMATMAAAGTMQETGLPQATPEGSLNTREEQLGAGIGETALGAEVVIAADPASPEAKGPIGAYVETLGKVAASGAIGRSALAMVKVIGRTNTNLALNAARFAPGLNVAASGIANSKFGQRFLTPDANGRSRAESIMGKHGKTAGIANAAPAVRQLGADLKKVVGANEALRHEAKEEYQLQRRGQYKLAA